MCHPGLSCVGCCLDIDQSADLCLAGTKTRNRKKKKILLKTNTLSFKSLGSVRLFFTEINTFIQQGCILIKSDTRDFYIVTNNFYLKKSCFFNFIFIKKCRMVSTKY